MKNLAIVSIVTLVLAFALGVYATTLDYTWNPQAGDAILSADVRQDHAEAESAVNNIDSTNISDSSITYAEMGANSVNATHLAPGAVHAVHIDSGAIMFDTQIAFNAISSDKLVSTTDTATNFSKMISGYYTGDGNDSRPVMNTYFDSNAGDTSGVWIPFTITRVQVWALDNSDVSFLNDRLIQVTRQAYYNGAGGWVFETAGVGGAGVEPLGAGYSDGSSNCLPTFYDSGDSHWFVVNREDNGGRSNGTPNDTFRSYYWTAWGY